MYLTIIIILSQKSYQKNLKNNLLVQEKTLKKYIIFIVPIEKEVTRIDKNGEELAKNISFALQFIYTATFLVRSLSNLVNNLSEGIHRIKCKFGHDDKECKTFRTKYWGCFLEYTKFKVD